MTKRQERCGLSWREIFTLHGLSHGETEAQLAHSFGVNERTIRAHISRAMRKLDAKTRPHAVVIAMRLGLFR
jgi:two-component system response regulator DesR